MKSETFCILPFIHLEARPDGFVAPCCLSKHFFQKEDGTYFNLSRDTMADVWHSTSLKDLRRSLLNGEKHSACQTCWNEEALGRNLSKRNRENNRWQVYVEAITDENADYLPRFVDLKLGTVCNLKCRICSPTSSSKWVKEWTDLFKTDGYGDARKLIGESFDRKTITRYFENESFWRDLEGWLPTIEHFEIYGGEPFMIEQHFELLEKCVSLGVSKSQSIHYNSNGTIFPTKAVEKIFPHFKRVEIMLSIDGIGQQFEYQRHPAKWREVEINIIRLRDSMPPGTVQICLTANSMNIHDLESYLAYFREKKIRVWMNILHGPAYYNIKNLPRNAKDVVRERLQNIDYSDILCEPLDHLINLLETEADPVSVTRFYERVRLHDQYRGESFEVVFPEWSRVLGMGE